MARHPNRPDAPDPYDLLPAVAPFQLRSDTLADGVTMPLEHVNDGAGGGNVSPPLSWSGAPAATRGYAVTLFDPDAPTGCGFWHWLLVGVPAEVTSLPAGAGAEGVDAAPPGSRHLRNDLGSFGYDGAAPPAGDGVHRYLFAVHALDTDDVELDDTDSAGYASFTLVRHTIGRAVLAAPYARD